MARQKVTFSASCPADLEKIRENVRQEILLVFSGRLARVQDEKEYAEHLIKRIYEKLVGEPCPPYTSEFIVRDAANRIFEYIDWYVRPHG